MDFSQIKGQEHAKRAAEIAVAGGHRLLFLGPRGQGKTMLAQAAGQLGPGVTHDTGDSHGLPLAVEPRDNEVLVAEAWPCACGGERSGVVRPAFPLERCTCTEDGVLAHLRALEPIFCIVDIVLEVPLLREQDYTANRYGEGTAAIARRVEQAREAQRLRFQAARFPAGTVNGDIEGVGGDMIAGNVLERAFSLREGATVLLNEACRRLKLDDAARWKATRLSRTIADLDGSVDIAIHHVAEAVQYNPWRFMPSPTPYASAET